MSADDFVERLTAASTEAKATLHELYGALKMCRKVIKESQEERARWENFTRDLVKESLEHELDVQLIPAVKDMGDKIKDQMDASTKKVISEFEKLENILMSGHSTGIPQDGGRRIDEIIKGTIR